MSNWMKRPLAAAGLALSVGVGCGVAPEVSEAEPLRNVEIPEDFTFATTQGLALTVRAGLTVIPNGGRLVVERASGAVVYSGALVPDQPLRLDVVVPKADRALVVKLVAEHASFGAEVVADGPTASVVFEEDS